MTTSDHSHAHSQTLFSDVHSFLNNTLGDLSRLRERIAETDTVQQQRAELFRKDIEQEHFEHREEINKFRYEFDECVHERVEKVLEAIDEMTANQKAKDRKQQDQLDKLSLDYQKVQVNLMHINGQWVNLKQN